MKKQFFVNVLIILFIVCALVSCRSTNALYNDEIVFTTVKLANQLEKSGEIDKAIEIYDSALSHTDNYILVYNKSILLAKDSRYSEAADICLKASEHYKKQSELFLDAWANYMILSGDASQAYDYLLNKWEEGKHDLKTAEALFRINPEEWNAVYSVLKR